MRPLELDEHPTHQVRDHLLARGVMVLVCAITVFVSRQPILSAPHIGQSANPAQRQSRTSVASPPSGMSGKRLTLMTVNWTLR